MKYFQELSSRLSFQSDHHGWKLVNEPPVTKGKDVEQWRTEPLRLNYPCHSQTVEHGVKTTSSVVSSYTDYDDQLGAAFAAIKSRQKLKGKVTRKRLLDKSC